MSKIKVAVIFGGKSNEHDVSVVSAAHVIRSIPKDKYSVVCIGITKKGHWLKYMGDVEDIANGKWASHPDNVTCILSPDPVHKGFIAIGEDGVVSPVKVDVIFPVLHGKNGEDGTIQGIFQMSEIPFVGCDLISSADCMDKDITHTVLEAHGIRTAKWVTMIFSDISRLEEKCDEMEEKLGYPMYVKPANCGSSVGISKAVDREGLKAGIKNAFVHDKKVVVEEEIKGLECECAVMGNENPFASTVGEISAANDFYDFDAKYNNSESKTYIPARIAEESLQAIREEAVRAYKAMGCGGLSRVDFFLCENGEIILNEINTLPGHTPISMYPQLMAHEGISFEEQEDRLIRLALERSDVDYE
jgi:D-alanine-D-alanine ligase